MFQRVDDLYNYLQQWISHLYGDVDDVDPDEAGFIPIDDSLPDEEEEEEEKENSTTGEEEEGSEREAPKSFLKLVEETFGFKSISQEDWEVSCSQFYLHSLPAHSIKVIHQLI